MPDFDELIEASNKAIANIVRIQELLELVEENCDSPKRVKLLVEIYSGWINTEIENLQWSSKRLERQLEAARKGCNASQTQNIGG